MALFMSSVIFSLTLTVQGAFAEDAPVKACAVFDARVQQNREYASTLATFTLMGARAPRAQAFGDGLWYNSRNLALNRERGQLNAALAAAEAGCWLMQAI